MIEITKKCTVCGVEKPTDSFTRNKSKKWLLDSSCKLCKSRVDKEYRRKNEHKLREYFKEYHLLNRDRKVLIACLWQKENKDKANIHKRHNEIRRSKRIPRWLSLQELQDIEALYKKAKDMSKVSGIEYHVDHIIPLNGKYVSGLHVLSNLQIISKEDNLSKSNKFMI